MATNQFAYRGRNDNGTETTATWKAAQNTPWIQARDANFRVRFAIQNDTALINNLDIQLQYSTDGSNWNNVTASSSVVRSSASANLTDAANLTQQLTGGSGTFIGLTGFDEVNGICGGNSMDVTATGNFEVEFSVQLRSAEVAAGATVYLRTINSDTASPWTSYSTVATMYAEWRALVAALPADTNNQWTDELAVFASTRAGWGDALAIYQAASFAALTVNLPPDVWGNLADPMTRLIGDHYLDFYADNLHLWADAVGITLEAAGTGADLTVNISDSALNLADSLAALRPMRAAPAADSMAMADALGALRRLFANLGADSAANLSDSLGSRLNLLARLSDSNNQWADQLAVNQAGFLALTVNLPPDDLASDGGGAFDSGVFDPGTFDATIRWADQLAYNLTVGAAALTVQISDSALNLADSIGARRAMLAGLSDSLNAWADSAAASRGLLSRPAADSFTLLDSLSAIRALSASLTDPAANLADSIAIARPLLLALTDPMTAPVDSIAAMRVMRAALTDDANTWADLLSKILTGQAALLLELSDTMGTLADTVSGFRTMRASLAADDANNFLDSRSVIRGLLVQSTDSAANLLDSLARTMVGLLRPELSDSALFLNDSIAGRLQIFATFVDSAANLFDQLTAAFGGVLHLTISPPPDSLNNFLDALAATRAMRAAIADSAANLADSVSFTAGQRLQLIDDAMNLADALAGFFELCASLPDNADNWADSVLQFGSGSGVHSGRLTTHIYLSEHARARIELAHHSTVRISKPETARVG